VIYSSLEFVILIATTVVLLQGADARGRQWILTLSSCGFFLWAGFLSITLFSFVVAIIWLVLVIGKRLPFLTGPFIALGVGLLLANLFLWKYAGWALGQMGMGDWPGLAIFTSQGLPIGISFYTLQGIAYLIDIRRGHAKPVGFLDLLLFKVLFAQLIAGPIVRYHDLMGQVEKPPKASFAEIVGGAELFALGAFKKLALADRAGELADPIFGNLSRMEGPYIVCATLLFSVQIWADFSGYVDMGRGAARMCGIHLPENFLSPYLATYPSDFWRRWHITLSQWIRDYIYIPLGGNRRSPLRNAANLTLTMFISGLWHGANWTFVIWGLYHGALLSLQHLGSRLFRRGLPLWLAQPLMLGCVVFGWYIFRAPDLTSALTGIKSVAGSDLAQLPAFFLREKLLTIGTFGLCGFAMFIQLAQEKRERLLPSWQNLHPMARGVGCGLLLLAAVAFRGQSASFIYFAF
jgi:alginate O-acetyltransferase complex protein AlgI